MCVFSYLAGTWLSGSMPVDERQSTAATRYHVCIQPASQRRGEEGESEREIGESEECLAGRESGRAGGRWGLRLGRCVTVMKCARCTLISASPYCTLSSSTIRSIMLHVALRPLPSLERQLASFLLCARSRRTAMSTRAPPLATDR